MIVAIADAVRSALDGDLVVDGVGQLGKIGASALDALKTLNRDERVLYFARMAADDEAVSESWRPYKRSTPKVLSGGGASSDRCASESIHKTCE